MFPHREVRALHTATTIRVYQAYSPEIGDAALRAGTFVAPFKRARMTWIKPSFLWMAYRCGWGRKPGQERVLGIDITRAGFEWALRNAALSHPDPALHSDDAEWRTQVHTRPVRVQWDPERNLRHGALTHRSIQIGLSGAAVDNYVDEWITAIVDVTPTMREIGTLVQAGDLDAAGALLPAERPYPLSGDLAATVGASG
jgi:hypothetical protein